MTLRGPLAIIVLILLVASLAVNFLIGGFVAARFGGFGEGAGIERIVSLGTRAFPQSLRQEIRDGFRERRGDFREAFRDMRQARMRMFEAMSAEPFDRAALDAALADVRAKTARLQELGQDITADVVEKASPAERAEIKPPRFLRR